jgi:hydroxyacylglutathione hydrolase
MRALAPGQQLVGRGPSAVTMERVADGVWLMRGGSPPPLVDRIMNVYFLEERDGVTVFDAGIRSMAAAIAHVGRKMGGIKRIVLGHAHPDHRGAAAWVDAPVWCHEAEVQYAEADDGQPYTDFSKLPLFTSAGPLRLAMRLFMHRVWDAGPVRVDRTLAEGDEVAGFEAIHLPGHAPGQIALWRARDRLALSTDCVYMLDVLTGEPSEPRLPHDAYNLDTQLARASARKLAALDPAVCWPGHVGPATGDVAGQLRRAADRA